jgi:D-alanyl-D-alanine carboxypeptidase/D-alanyl-D-alanine-endopeptidase (penicillin-binding protein 4)
VRSRSTLLFGLLFLLCIVGWILAGVLAFRVPRGTTAVAPPPAAPESKFAGLFREWTAHPQLAGTLVAFCVLDEEGQTLFASPLAETALCPASALKILSTGAALGVLGPEFRFETTLLATTPLDNTGRLAGDLVLVGGGDPTLSQDDLAQLADAAIAAGLKSVAGVVRVDTSLFPADPMSEHWNWGDIGNGYGAGAFALNLDRNRLALRFEPGAQPGEPARFLGEVHVAAGTRWENHVVTGPAGSGDNVLVYSEPYGRVITMRGSVPADADVFTVSAANPDPPAVAAELLRARLEEAGVRFESFIGPFPDTERTLLARDQSAPLSEIIEHTHAASDNLEAQCLFLTVGLRQGAPPESAVRDYWTEAGVQFVGLRLIDGSGLARANMIRPLDLARVAHAAKRRPHGQVFFESLSSYVQGHARGKIGGMSGVKTQVGYLRHENGRELTYALMGNGLAPGREFWARLEKLLEAVRVTPLE